MKISKDSWHYRLVWKFGDRSPRTNLCLYFWQVVGNVLKVIVLGVIGVVFFPIWGPAVGISLLYDLYRQKHPRKMREPPEPKGPSLIYLWVKAKKDRVCPKIEFVRDES